MTSTTDLLDYLVDRALHPDHTFVGASSDAMLDAALSGARWADVLPMDKHDLARCEETYRRAPAWLQRRMDPHLALARRAVDEGGLFCRGCETFGHSSTRAEMCRGCQQAVKVEVSS